MASPSRVPTTMHTMTHRLSAVAIMLVMPMPSTHRPRAKVRPEGKPGADAVFEYQSQYAPQNDEDHVDHGGNHSFSCFHTAMR